LMQGARSHQVQAAAPSTAASSAGAPVVPVGMVLDPHNQHHFLAASPEHVRTGGIASAAGGAGGREDFLSWLSPASVGAPAASAAAGTGVGAGTGRARTAGVSSLDASALLSASFVSRGGGDNSTSLNNTMDGYQADAMLREQGLL
jgi:hypothetical protein